jgi:hypothetical protein
MHRQSAALIFLLSGTYIFAQISNTPGSAPKSASASEKTGDPVVLYADRPDNAGCPVDLFASRRSISQMMSVADARQADSAQGLHLTLSHTAGPAIEAIEVTVFGIPQKQGVFPASSASSETLSKTFDLQRKADSQSLGEADIWMSHVGSFSRVDLNAVTYVDGTTWHATTGLKCSVLPSNVVLVGRR